MKRIVLTLIVGLISITNVVKSQQVPSEKFKNFKCEYVDDKVMISWTSLFDELDEVFYVEKSTNEINFEVISYVVVLSGIYKSPQMTYTFVDMEPFENYSFYRIRSSGTGITSEVKSIKK